MSDYEKKRIDDDPILQIFKNWQFYGSVAMALIAIGSYIADHRVMAGAIERGQEFQSSQIEINTRLKTLIETHDHRLGNLENWRDEMNKWNYKKSND